MTAGGAPPLGDARSGWSEGEPPVGQTGWGPGDHRYEEATRAELSRLRADFPRLGFLVIAHGWYAIESRHRILMSSGPAELRRALAPAREAAAEGGGTRLAGV
ncbi:hypothetical protein [Sphaerisporangium perillae]|uniref:hypothetical protein n=1 Tax=Sphaerisporangium perillae TaxID=2935860 RepID=UPI00200BD903|nr:hypothetical protein [Sphaerisporangium perillae]